MYCACVYGLLFSVHYYQHDAYGNNFSTISYCKSIPTENCFIFIICFKHHCVTRFLLLPPTVALPCKLGSNRAHFQYSAGQGLAFHHRRGVHQLLSLHQFTRDAGRHARLAWRDDYPYPGMPASSHRTTTRIHHKTHQETAKERSHTNSEPLECYVSGNSNTGY